MSPSFKLSLLVSFLLLPLFLLAQPPGSKALRFNGSSNYVNCGTINLSGSQVTIQGWIKAQSFKSAHPYITSFAGIEQSGAHCAVRIGDGTIPNNKVQFILYIGGTHYKLHSSQALSTNQWYHLAATYDGSQMKIYINGVLDTIRNQTGTITSNNTFELGRNYADSRILSGELDEVSVFNTALSQGTIRDWMCRRITTNHPNYVSLVGYWPLDEGSGSSTADQSGNGNTGTLVSSPTWKNSGAPVGDESIHQYASTFDLGLAHPSGDSLHILSTSGSFEGVHLYRVDSVPYVTNAPSGVQFLDTTRHWGVFPITSADYTVNYYYGNNPATSGYDCNLSFGRRNDGSLLDWTLQIPDSVDYTNEVMTLHTSGQKELILAISENGPHSFSYIIDEPLCFGESNGEATVSISGGLAPYTYSWQTGSTTTMSGSVAAGAYVLTITDANNCTSIDTAIVSQPDSLSFFANSTPSVCKDTNTGTGTAIATGGVGAYNFLWSDANNSTTQTASGLFPGNYTVTINDANGCEIVGNVTVGSTGPDPQPDLGGDTNICEGIVFGLVADGPDAPYASYAWSTGSTSSIAVITMSGTYRVTVENSVGCSASDTVEVSYVAPIEVQLGPPNQSAIGSLTLDAGSGFLTYQWNTLATSSSITVTQSATYWVNVKDSNLCKSSDTVSVTITPSGVEANPALDGLYVYPNPASQFVTIEASSHWVSRPYLLQNLSGSIMTQGQLSAKTQIDLVDLPHGVYFISIQAEGQPNRVLRFVK